MQGKTINGYTLQQQLGVGGMAEVWLAENAIGKKAAVKLLLPRFCGDEAIVARFQNEAKVMVQLDHPNIRQVYDYGSIDGRPCIVMEYLEGDDLKALMKSGKRFTDAELRQWWNQIADALNYTHAKGIVHRDIKPSNIFLDKKGNIKLLDFGIAKIRESISMTQTGAMMGTLMYMSPEQVKDSKHIGPESDNYSLAVTFVHLLTGKAPYDSTTSSDYDIRKGIVEIPLDLSSVPATWQGFLAPYLQKDPEKRPALRPFEAVVSEASDKTDESDDDGTIVGETVKKQDHPKQEPKKAELKRGNKPEPKNDGKSPNKKKGLWIGLAAAVVVALLLLVVGVVVLLKSRKPADDPDTKAYKACKNVMDYRAYLSEYGIDALHFADAMAFIDNYMADSIQKAQADRSEAEARDSKEKLEQMEKKAFDACTTVGACDSYLSVYPQGRYVKEVREKRKQLRKQLLKAAEEPGKRREPKK